jgi:hypothetical protein
VRTGVAPALVRHSSRSSRSDDWPDPDITEATVIRHGVLRLRFADGLSGQVEVLDRMRGPVFDQARTPEGFAEVAVDPETGTVVWPGGADLATDTLYERVRTGAWPDHDLAA